MDAPPIQYATTSDGVSIAFWVMGEGEGVPYVWLPGIPFSLADVSRQPPPWRRRWELLAARRPVVFLDFRGQGLSGREADDFSLEAHVRDVEAVVDRLSLERFALHSFHSTVAIEYAARHPERISHLVLRSAVARMRDLGKVPQFRALRRLLGQDWDMYIDAFAQLAYGWARGNDARELAAVFHDSCSQQLAIAKMEAMASADVTLLLPKIQAPTLVLHRLNNVLEPLELATSVASQIPNCRLVTPFEDAFELAEDAEAEVRIITDFLGEGIAAQTDSAVPSGTAVILFADVVDSTALSEQMGNADFRDRSRRLEERVRTNITAHAGTPVQGRTLGDGVLGTFTSAAEAIEAAIACASAGEEVGLALHLGVHAGDVIRERAPDGRDNVHGQAVSIAARISDLSAPNEVLVSGTVRDLARASSGVSFEDRGERDLKGVGEPVRVFAVRAALRSEG